MGKTGGRERLPQPLHRLLGQLLLISSRLLISLPHLVSTQRISSRLIGRWSFGPFFEGPPEHALQAGRKATPHGSRRKGAEGIVPRPVGLAWPPLSRDPWGVASRPTFLPLQLLVSPAIAVVKGPALAGHQL